MKELRYSTARSAASGSVTQIPGTDIQGGQKVILPFARLTRRNFPFFAMLLDALVVVLAMYAADFGYNAVKHGWAVMGVGNLKLGAFAAIVFICANAARHAYCVAEYRDMSGLANRTFRQWNFAFLSAATLGFMTRTIEDSSRGTFIVFYLVGLCALYAIRADLARIARMHSAGGGALAARMFVVGFPADVETFLRERRPAQHGFEVVAAWNLDRHPAAMAENLAQATAKARELMPDDIFIVVPWQNAAALDACVTAFMGVPAKLHLYVYPNSALIRFAGSAVGTSGGISSFRLHGYGMSALGLMAKRASDIVLSLAGLVVLLPVFAAAALAIKLETGGPVLFFQTRSGFNKRPFRIVKFRSMTASDDDGGVRQATRGDTRITRVGAVLRRFNIDELPQLYNVLRGDMSLVGPRPHALVHDQAFESGIALYARRHNVRPGLTGWAQVNGFRGETDTREKIEQRVSHDLHYIDNWSFNLDIWILFLTVFSPKAFRNAR